MTLTRQQLARYIDHTLLKPDAPDSAIEQLCAEAREWGFAAVCVQPFWVSRAAERLAETEVRVATVVGFPHGATSSAAKYFEAGQAIDAGATELDMVLNLGALKSGHWRTVETDISTVVWTGHEKNVIVKVILECCYLTDEEKRRAAQIVAEAGADFVKTSTGFGPGGATVGDVRLLAETVAGRCGVKAAGGIRTLESALVMIDAGATRIGTSAGVEIVKSMRGE